MRRADSLISQPLPLVRTLSLSDNPIANWSDIDALITWLPELQELGISFEPFKLCELLMVGRVPKHNVLTISQQDHLASLLVTLLFLGCRD